MTHTTTNLHPEQQTKKDGGKGIQHDGQKIFQWLKCCLKNIKCCTLSWTGHEQKLVKIIIGFPRKKKKRRKKERPRWNGNTTYPGHGIKGGVHLNGSFWFIDSS